MNARTEKLRAGRRQPGEAAKVVAAIIAFREYQLPVFWAELGILVLHWSRQIGKSYVLAAWAIYRVLDHPGRLVTVLSNSKDNGIEFIHKCTEICELLRVAFEEEDLSPDDLIENMRIECRIKNSGKWGRIKVLAANPRTARGFSGDLVLDEYAHHEDSVRIWDAAEPILSARADYQCRIAGTGNGRFNMFYRMAALAKSRGKAEGFRLSEAGFPVSRVTRTDAWKMGVKIFDTATRKEITPEQARVRALDKRSYDQNYECLFADENMALLTMELINAAEYSTTEGGLLECRIEEQDWSLDTLEFLKTRPGPLCVGLDVGRSRDITCLAVGEKQGQTALTRAMLRLQGMRIPRQQERLNAILRLPNFGRGSGDATGLGLGLCEGAQEIVGPYRFEALHFAQKENREVRGVMQDDKALVTELMALDLLKAFEDRRIRIPCESALRDALRKPESVHNGKQVRIAVERDEAGHADEFWALALMVRALKAGTNALSRGDQILIPPPAVGSRRFVPRVHRMHQEVALA